MAFKWVKQALRKRKLNRTGVSLDKKINWVGYGDRSGIWVVCPNLLSIDSIVYSFGVGNNISWDLAMISHYGLELHAFDPTPRSIDWIKRQNLPPRFYFHPVGLSGFDGLMQFRVPVGEHKFNYSSVKAKLTPGQKVGCNVKRLSSLQKELGHNVIDILKMDIEGEETKALSDVLASPELPGQLLVEFHYNYSEISYELFLDLVSQLRAAGYWIFHISERGYEFSFIHDRLLGAATESN